MLEAIYSITKDAFKKLQPRERWSARRSRGFMKKLVEAQRAIERDELLQFLSWRYGNEPILRRCGYVYPVAVYAAPRTQWESIESVLGQLHCIQGENFIVNDSSYRENIAIRLGLLLLSPTKDTPTYTMRTLATDGVLRLDCELGRYYQAYDTCEALEWELRSTSRKLAGTTDNAFRTFSNYLLLRERLHQQVANPVCDGSGRSAAIGISTLIAYREGESFQLLVRRRAKRGVPLRQGLLHVIPSFMFEPTTIEIEEEFSVTHNIFREYLEELFDFPELDGEGDPKQFYGDPRLVYLRTLLDSGEAHLFLTGVAVNLMNLRPEICTLLVINTPEWCERSSSDPQLRWRFNAEFITKDDHTWVSPKELKGKIPLLDDDFEMVERCYLTPARTVPAGAAAFWLGVDTLRALRI